MVHNDHKHLLATQSLQNKLESCFSCTRVPIPRFLDIFLFHMHEIVSLRLTKKLSAFVSLEQLKGTFNIDTKGVICIQWKPSILDTLGPERTALITEVSSFQVSRCTVARHSIV